jgi:hypothetical protein
MAAIPDTAAESGAQAIHCKCLDTDPEHGDGNRREVEK